MHCPYSWQLDFHFQGEHYFDISNSDDFRGDSCTVFNTRVGYQINDNLKVALLAKNLSDEECLVYSFDFTGPAGLNRQLYAPPRWAAHI